MRIQTIFIFMLTVISSSALAFPVVKLNNQKTMPLATEKMAEIVSESLRRPLTADELGKISESVKMTYEAQANTQVAKTEKVVALIDEMTGDRTNYEDEWYVCVGGKLSLLVMGLQGLKCVSTSSGKIMNVFFNAESWAKEVTALVAKGYVGINVGAALDIGGMRISHTKGGDRSYSGRYNRVEKSESIVGGTINGSWFLLGGLLGYYEKEDGTNISLFAWQPGFAAEVSASDIQVVEGN